MDDSGKHLRIYAPGRTKAVRSYILTPDHMTYTKENIKRMINRQYRERDRERLLARMYADWNMFEAKERVQIILLRRKSLLVFAQHEEAVRMVMEQGFRSREDAAEYRRYLEGADRELNILRKYVKSSMDYFSVYESKLQVIMDYLETSDQIGQKSEYETSGQIGQKSEYETSGQIGQKSEDKTSSQVGQKFQAMEAYKELREAGVSPVRLYRLNQRSEHVLQKINDFKRKLFVDKKIVDRILTDARKNPEVFAQSEIKQQKMYQRKPEDLGQRKGGIKHE